MELAVTEANRLIFNPIVSRVSNQSLSHWWLLYKIRELEIVNAERIVWLAEDGNLRMERCNLGRPIVFRPWHPHHRSRASMATVTDSAAFPFAFIKCCSNRLLHPGTGGSRDSPRSLPVAHLQSASLIPLFPLCCFMANFRSFFVCRCCPQRRTSLSLLPL